MKLTRVLLAAAVGIVAVLLLLAELEEFLATETGRAIRRPMFVVGVVTTLAWLGAMAAIRIRRQPRTPIAGPATPDLGPEPPAVTNLLASDFDVDREAVPATLLDLAARGVVSIQDAGDSFLIRVRDVRGGSLAPFEERVLALVRSRAENGVVPAGALTTGPRERAAAWWRGFRGEVIDDAQGRGLSRDLWDGRILRRLAIAAAVPAPFFFVAAAHVGAAFIYGVGAAAIIGGAATRRRQRDTQAGLASASRWLGVGRYLRDGAFADLPPTAVVVWERYLAYAAALDAAPAAVRAIPMGADETRRAWSAYGGEWRLVRIRYPWLFPPAWGWRPWAALLVSAGGLVVVAGAWRLILGIGWPDPTPTIPPVVLAIVRVVVVLAAAVGTVGALWAVSTLLRAAADLGSGDEITGLVLRVRVFGKSNRSPGRHYVALDDGRSPVIRAWRVRPELSRAAVEYEGARAVASRHLRFVRELRRA